MPEQLEARLAYLEAEVALLKHKAQKDISPKLCWEQITGKFSENSAYDEAMRLGREYRACLSINS